MSKVAIVCIDDEDTILNCLKMQLQRYYGDEFILEFSSSGSEGLEIIDKLKSDGINDIVTICDLNLGNTTGDRVLSSIHARYPDIVKLLLSGFIPPEMINKLKSSINLDGYIYKPWDSQKLIEAVDSAISKTAGFSNDIVIGNKKINKTAAICILSDNAVQQKVSHHLNQISCGMYEIACVENTHAANDIVNNFADQGVRHLVIAADWGAKENDLIIWAISMFVSVKIIVLNGNSDQVVMNGMIKGIELADTFDGISCIKTTCEAIDSVAKRCYSMA